MFKVVKSVMFESCLRQFSSFSHCFWSISHPLSSNARVSASHSFLHFDASHTCSPLSAFSFCQRVSCLSFCPFLAFKQMASVDAAAGDSPLSKRMLSHLSKVALHSKQYSSHKNLLQAAGSPSSPSPSSPGKARSGIAGSLAQHHRDVRRTKSSASLRRSRSPQVRPQTQENGKSGPLPHLSPGQWVRSWQESPAGAGGPPGAAAAAGANKTGVKSPTSAASRSLPLLVRPPEVSLDDALPAAPPSPLLSPLSLQRAMRRSLSPVHLLQAVTPGRRPVLFSPMAASHALNGSSGAAGPGPSRLKAVSLPSPPPVPSDSESSSDGDFLSDMDGGADDDGSAFDGATQRFVWKGPAGSYGEAMDPLLRRKARRKNGQSTRADSASSDWFARGMRRSSRDSACDPLSCFFFFF